MDRITEAGVTIILDSFLGDRHYARRVENASCLARLTLVASYTSTDRDWVKASGIERPSAVETNFTYFKRIGLVESRSKRRRQINKCLHHAINRAIKFKSCLNHSYLEVLQCMSNKAELLAVKKMLDRRSARLLPVTEAITLLTTELMESSTLSHSLQIGDALIAATAIEHELLVLTTNVKNFGAVASLTIEAFMP